MNSLFTALTVALALATVGCKSSRDSESTSAVKEFGNPDTSVPQQITVLVPQGGSTTAMMALSVPITANKVRVSTNCNLQLAQLMIRNSFGQVGHLVPSAGDQTVWVAASGNTHTITHVQFVVNNFGAPKYCQLSIARGPEVTPLFSGQNAEPSSVSDQSAEPSSDLGGGLDDSVASDGLDASN